MRVLVTGHEGYLGTVICEMLEAAGHDLVGLDTGLFADCLLGPAPPAWPTLRMDIRDVQAADLEGFEAVVHLAALSNDPLGDLAPRETYEINHRASLRLARAARAAGVRRFLYASTCSVYGAVGPDGLACEGTPLGPITPYARSKVMAEEALHRLAGDDFEPVFLRNATAFGYSARHRADIVLNNLVATAYLDGVVRVLSDGSPWRPLVHVRDIGGAFLAALEASRAQVQDVAINIGSAAANLTISQIAEVAARVTGARLEITGEMSSDHRSYRVDFTRLSERLPDFQPQRTVEQGAAELFDAYRRHGLTADDFCHRYHRLQRLRFLRAAGRLDTRIRWTR